MATINTTLAPTGTDERPDNVIGPHVFARKLKERERQKRLATTLVAEAIEQEAAAP
jgi:hypothetical protein